MQSEHLFVKAKKMPDNLNVDTSPATEMGDSNESGPAFSSQNQRKRNSLPAPAAAAAVANGTASNNFSSSSFNNSLLRRRYSVIESPSIITPHRSRRRSDDAALREKTPSASKSKNFLSTSAEKSMSRTLMVAVVGVFCTMNFALAMCNSVIAPFFPLEAIDKKGGTATLAGLVMGSFECVMFLLAPLIGSHMYDIGVRFLLISGPFIVACTTILFGLLDYGPPAAPFFVCCFATRLLAGVGAIFYHVTSIAQRSILFPESFGFITGIIQASFTLGLIAGPAVGGLLYSAGGYAVPFYVTGALAFFLDLVQLVAIPARLLRAAPSSTSEESGGDDNAGVEEENSLRRPSLRAFCCHRNILMSFLLYCWAGFAVTFYESIISLHILPLLDNNISHVGYIILIAGVAEAVTAPLIGWLQDKKLLSPRLSVVLGLILGTVGLLVMGPSPLIYFLLDRVRLWTVIVGTALHGFGLGCFFSALVNIALQGAEAAGYGGSPKQMETTSGVLAGGFATFYSFGAFVGPIVGGVLYDQFKFCWASTIVALMSFFVLICAVVLWGGEVVITTTGLRRSRKIGIDDSV